MKRRDIVLVCSLLAVIVLGMFTYTYLEKSQKVVEEVVPVVTDSNEVSEIKRIEAKHFYRDGVHTIVGEIMLQTTCDLLSYDARVAESYPEMVSFDFKTINNSNQEDCAKATAPQRFLVNASASSVANLSATMNGTPVELNLIEASANETPESFELFIKG